MDVENFKSLIQCLDDIEEGIRTAEFDLINIRDEMHKMIRDIREIKDEIQGEVEEWVS